MVDSKRCANSAVPRKVNDLIGKRSYSHASAQYGGLNRKSRTIRQFQLIPGKPYGEIDRSGAPLTRGNFRFVVTMCRHTDEARRKTDLKVRRQTKQHKQESIATSSLRPLLADRYLWDGDHAADLLPHSARRYVANLER
jgi:hypothetical protein